MKITRVLVLTGIVGLMVGCSSADSGGGPASGDANTIDVAAQVAGDLDSLGIPADDGSISCDGALQAETGESTTCEFTNDGQPIRLVTTVDSVDGADVHLSVSAEALASPPEVLAERVSQQLQSAMGANLDEVECSGELKAETGAATDCTVSQGDLTREVKVTVTSIEGGLIIFDITDE